MATHEATAPWIGAVVGENLRRKREAYGWTQAEVSRSLQRYGLRWTRSHVASLEAGNRETLDIGALFILARSLGGITVQELFEGDGDVRVAPEAIATREHLRHMFGGSRPHDSRFLPLRLTGRALEWQQRAERAELVTPGATHPGSGMPAWYDVTPVQADSDLADRLGVLPEDVYRTAQSLFAGRTMHEERDRRLRELGEMNANERRARRGHITRELSKQIESTLAARRASEEREPDDG